MSADGFSGMPEKQGDSSTESYPLLWVLLGLHFLKKFTLILRRARLQGQGTVRGRQSELSFLVTMNAPLTFVDATGLALFSSSGPNPYLTSAQHLYRLRTGEDSSSSQTFLTDSAAQMLGKACFLDLSPDNNSPLGQVTKQIFLMNLSGNQGPRMAIPVGKARPPLEDTFPYQALAQGSHWHSTFPT